ncbi:MAG: squalene synthase HpnC [Actinomycetota bacterium]|nr:squalene synthase HpnC [Actinomycetota bacterium]
MTSAVVGNRMREDFRYCQSIASRHYENFSVVSFFIPKALRPHFSAIYAFCRGVDDLGDEFAGDRRRALEKWRSELNCAFDGSAHHPIFRALSETIRHFGLKYEEFDKLIKANEMDQEERSYKTIDDTLEYCRHSADPVGRLVLGLFGLGDSRHYKFSDAICTGLQLANFLQDTADDLRRGRAYWPQDDLAKFGLSQKSLADYAFGSSPSPDVLAIAAWGEHEVKRIQEYFNEGASLERIVPKRLSLQLQAYRMGGEAVLDGIRRQGFNPFIGRPQVTKNQKLLIMGRIIAGAARPLHGTEHPPTGDPANIDCERRGETARKRSRWAARNDPTDRVTEAYRACTDLVRRAGSSFYYGMRLLPAEKRSAIFSVYAWSRVCDDAVDDYEGEEAVNQLSHAQQLYDQARTERWMDSPDLISVALGDAIRRFHLSDSEFRSLIRGMQMDLEPRRYQSYEELQRYCLDVAGAVGILCVEIFGFKDRRTRELAARLGVAMQITNIIRDLKEDSERGRCYLPAEDLEKFDVTIDEVLKGRYSPKIVQLLSFEADRAENYFQDATELFSLIEPDSVRCLKLLYGVYHLILTKTRRARFDVWSSRIRVSNREALQIMGGTFWRTRG